MTIHIPDYNVDTILSFLNPPILFLTSLGTGNFYGFAFNMMFSIFTFASGSTSD